MTSTWKAPGHWPVHRVCDIATILQGHPYPSASFHASRGFPLIRIRDIDTDTTTMRYTGDVSPHIVIREGDVLVAMDGYFRCRVWRGPDAVLNQRVCRVTCDPDIIPPRLFAWLLDAELRRRVPGTGRITVAHLSLAQLSHLPLALPPRADQSALLARLEAIAPRLSRVTANMAALPQRLDQYRTAVLATAYAGCLVPPSTIGGQRHVNLAAVADITYGISCKASPTAPGPRLLRITDIAGDTVAWDDVPGCTTPPEDLERHLLRPDDVVVIRTGSRTGQSILLGNVPAAVASSYLVRLRPHAILPAYLHLAIQSPQVQHVIAAASTGIAQRTCSATKLGSIVINVPSRAEQSAIVSRARQFLAPIQSLACRLRSTPFAEDLRAIQAEVMVGIA
jgi:type I restriction enzyme, S subunit